LCFLFLQGADGLPCAKSADIDDSGDLNVSDAITLLGCLFRGRPCPLPPFPGCGIDPSSDHLTCDRYERCP
jgi:hypothetical protein